MSKRKKIIIMSSLVFLLALTAVLNVLLANNITASGDTTVVPTANYFSSFRADSQVTRNQEIMELNEMLDLYEKGSEKYNEIVAMKLKIVEMMEKELELETMIKAKGFSDAVVVLGMDTDSVNVFINSDELNYNTALSIWTMLKSEVGAEPGKVIIMPINAQV